MIFSSPKYFSRYRRLTGNRQLGITPSLQGGGGGGALGKRDEFESQVRRLYAVQVSCSDPVAGLHRRPGRRWCFGLLLGRSRLPAGFGSRLGVYRAQDGQPRQQHWKAVESGEECALAQAYSTAPLRYPTAAHHREGQFLALWRYRHRFAMSTGHGSYRPP